MSEPPVPGHPAAPDAPPVAEPPLAAPPAAPPSAAALPAIPPAVAPPSADMPPTARVPPPVLPPPRPMVPPDTAAPPPVPSTVACDPPLAPPTPLRIPYPRKSVGVGLPKLHFVLGSEAVGTLALRLAAPERGVVCLNRSETRGGSAQHGKKRVRPVIAEQWSAFVDSCPHSRTLSGSRRQPAKSDTMR
jgi:hypothetical protein